MRPIKNIIGAVFVVPDMGSQFTRVPQEGSWRRRGSRNVDGVGAIPLVEKVPWFLGFSVSSFLVSCFLRLSVSSLLHLFVSKFQSFKVSKFQKILEMEKIP